MIIFVSNENIKNVIRKSLSASNINFSSLDECINTLFKAVEAANMLDSDNNEYIIIEINKSLDERIDIEFLEKLKFLENKDFGYIKFEDVSFELSLNNMKIVYPTLSFISTKEDSTIKNIVMYEKHLLNAYCENTLKTDIGAIIKNNLRISWENMAYPKI